MTKIRILEEFNQFADFAALSREALNFVKSNGGTKHFSDDKLAAVLNEATPELNWNDSKIGHFISGKTTLKQQDIADIVKIMAAIKPHYERVLAEVNKGRDLTGQQPLPSLFQSPHP